MCQKTNKVTETKSENDRPSITGEDVHFMTLVHKERVKRLLAISLAVSLEKVRDSLESETVKE